MKPYVTIDGEGHFNFKGRRDWRSHRVHVGFKVDLVRNTARVVKRYRQKPYGINYLVYPTIEEEEMTRMTQAAIEKAHRKASRLAAEGANRDSSTMIFIEVRKDPHAVHLCELCQECTRTIEILQGAWIKITHDQKWNQRSEPIRELSRAINAIKISQPSADVDDMYNCLPQDAKVRILYHQTSRKNADKIIRSQVMRKGSKGALGAAIYFAESPEETTRKARRHGVILRCLVYVGTPLNVSTRHPKMKKMTFHKLVHAHRCDSVLATFFPSGNEIAVYNSDQVLAIECYDV